MKKTKIKLPLKNCSLIKYDKWEKLIYNQAEKLTFLYKVNFYLLQRITHVIGMNGIATMEKNSSRIFRLNKKNARELHVLESWNKLALTIACSDALSLTKGKNKNFPLQSYSLIKYDKKWFISKQKSTTQ